jgi:L-seryl-tRNA(Ser) seleniumtransferase
MDDKRPNLPKIHRLLDRALVDAYGHDRVVKHARYWVQVSRERVTDDAPVDEADIRKRMSDSLGDEVQAVINATGVLLHTNLGRAPWSEAARAGADTAAGYCTVEFELRSGKRGHRGASVEDRIMALMKAPAALVVNNCAGAVLLMLAALAHKKKVLVSRGELVEIGGGFRVPDVMAASGAELIEVGTTNRTHLADFELALDSDVAGILKIHHSNFKQVGFVTQPTLSAIGALNTRLLVDLGSGQLDYAQSEPSVAEALAAGADVICMSGDKLLGGPQSGIVIGQPEAIQAMRRHPMYRALRPDKTILGALQGTLDDWLCHRKTPLQAMRSVSNDTLAQVIAQWIDVIPKRFDPRCVETEATVGGGSLPGQTIPSLGLSLGGDHITRIRQALRATSPPIICRLADSRLLFDARTIQPLGRSDPFIAGLMSVLATV